MAIITEARMQQLRGKYNQLNKEAMLPGEIAICDDHNPIVRTNKGYKEILTQDNAEYFEDKVTDINNAISSTNKAVDKANKAVADTLKATNYNTQRVDNALTQLETDKRQAISDMETATTETLNNVQTQADTRLDATETKYNELSDQIKNQIKDKIGINDTQASATTTYSSEKIETRLNGLSFSVTENGILRVSY